MSMASGYRVQAYDVPVFAPEVLSRPEQQRLQAEIGELLRAVDGVLVAHYYTEDAVQEVAELTGGCVADSLEMARFGRDHPASTLVVAGVRFMGETAGILSPEKRIIMPTLAAECSLDLGCPPAAFAAFCDEHPDRTVVVYANTSAAVKAGSDWVVTSSIALDVVTHLHDQGEKILWAPDRHLGHYIAEQTGADMLLWDGACVVHEEFRAQGVNDLKALYPDAAVLVHPESPAAVVELADVVGSTSQLIAAARTLPNDTFIVATDRGIFYRMRNESPDRHFLEAPTSGHGATCKSCAHCPWMAMNELAQLAEQLRRLAAGQCENQIRIDPELARQARVPLDRMLAFGAGRSGPAAPQRP